MILETQWAETELLFQAYSSSNALYYRFESEGEASSEAHIVIDNEGTDYGLLLDSTAFLYGGMISLPIKVPICFIQEGAIAWNAFKKKEGDFLDALHFMVQGANVPGSIESMVALDSRDLGVFFRDLSIELELYELDHNEEWNPMFSSRRLLRVKKSGSGEFDYNFSGFLLASLARGTYLVQMRG